VRKKVIAKIVVCLLPIIFVLLIAIIISVTFASALSDSATAATNYNSDSIGSGGLSENVLAYQDEISTACAKYGISDYVALAMAVMQQESGGVGSDPMQCSECPLNTRYPQTPGGITDAEYSIDIGIAYLASCLKSAGCTSPSDIPGISLALQGYNFGGGYIAWAQERGGYSPDNAAEFSSIKAAAMAWSGYGDPEYVSHVLRYYTVIPTGALFGLPLQAGTISRGWGRDGDEFHKGIDFAAQYGTKIYAAESGTVTYAQYGSAPYGGYGNVVVIKHDDTYTTLYGHCSKLLVSAGQTVKRGQVIALVGSTGDSTGNHCHFEVRVAGDRVDPAAYLGITVK
jgi:hypothetical protein